MDFDAYIEWLRANRCTVSETYMPFFDLESFHLKNKFDYTMDNFTPRPCQSLAWPPIVAGRNVVLSCPRGSGKTMSYGIPMIEHILKKNNTYHNVCAAVICPAFFGLTENSELNSASHSMGIHGVTLESSSTRFDWFPKFRRHQFSVGGITSMQRLNEFGHLNFKGVDFVVVEDLDFNHWSFEKDLHKIKSLFSPNCQFVFTGDTNLEAYHSFIEQIAPDPVYITIDPEINPARKVNYDVKVIPTWKRDDAFKEVVNKGKLRGKRAVVISKHYYNVHELSESLKEDGTHLMIPATNFEIEEMRGFLDIYKKIPRDMTIVMKEECLKQIDLINTDLIIFYDIPKNILSYEYLDENIKDGAEVLGFVTENDREMANKIVTFLKSRKISFPDELEVFANSIPEEEED